MMDAGHSIKEKSCCMVVLPDLHTAGLACLELHLKNPMSLAVSMMNKPDKIVDNEDFFRVKSIGTIICRGFIAQTLTRQITAQNKAHIEMKDLLTLIGIPTLHEEIYDQALKSGLVVLLLQGDGESLRQGCHLLKEVSIGKPVLYLV